jgi:hypothetical protein
MESKQPKRPKPISNKKVKQQKQKSDLMSRNDPGGATNDKQMTKGQLKDLKDTQKRIANQEARNREAQQIELEQKSKERKKKANAEHAERVNDEKKQKWLNTQ